MMASNGPPDEADVGREVRSVVDEARRSVAEGPPVDAVDWIWAAEKRLRLGQC